MDKKEPPENILENRQKLETERKDTRNKKNEYSYLGKVVFVGVRFLVF